MNTEIISLNLGEEQQEGVGKRFIHEQNKSQIITLFTPSDEIKQLLQDLSDQINTVIAWGAETDSPQGPDSDFFIFTDVTPAGILHIVSCFILGEITKKELETAKKLRQILKKEKIQS